MSRTEIGCEQIVRASIGAAWNGLSCGTIAKAGRIYHGFLAAQLIWSQIGRYNESKITGFLLGFSGGN